MANVRISDAVTRLAPSHSREPAAKELSRLKQYLDQQRARFSGDADAAQAVAPSDAPAVAPAYEAAAWVALSRALMNVDEFITRE